VRNQYRSTSKRGATTKPKLPKFPGAKMFGADKASFVKKRKATLQDYINGLIGNNNNNNNNKKKQNSY